MIIQSSHLNLRFYKRDGWTRELLEAYLISGKILDSEQDKGDKPSETYFIADSLLNIAQLYKDFVTKVVRWSNTATEELSDLEYLESFF